MIYNYFLCRDDRILALLKTYIKLSEIKKKETDKFLRASTRNGEKKTVIMI